jgi:hypothetical protein
LNVPLKFGKKEADHDRVMKKDWNSPGRAKNPVDVTPEKPGSSVFCSKIKV